MPTCSWFASIAISNLQRQDPLTQMPQWCSSKQVFCAGTPASDLGVLHCCGDMNADYWDTPNCSCTEAALAVVRAHAKLANADILAYAAASRGVAQAHQPQGFTLLW